MDSPFGITLVLKILHLSRNSIDATCRRLWRKFAIGSFSPLSRHFSQRWMIRRCIGLEVGGTFA